MDGYRTTRLEVQHWRTHIDGGDLQKWLETGLRDVLTRPVLRHLPPSFQLGHGADAIADWVAARTAESDVYLVIDRMKAKLLGLLVLADTGQPPPLREIHLGYLLAEHVWGKGVASELIAGFVEASRAQAPVTLTAGVGRDNPASARVLDRVGFQRNPEQSDDETDVFQKQLR